MLDRGKPVRSVKSCKAKPSRRRSALSMYSNGRSLRETCSVLATASPATARSMYSLGSRTRTWRMTR
jgi:hypothetical protein